MVNDSDFLQLKKFINMVSPIENEFFSELRSITKYRKLKKNDFFSCVGDLNKEFGFVIEGVLRIFYLSEGGQEHNKHFLIQNNFVAASINTNRKSIVSIQALCPTILISIEHTSFVSGKPLLK